MLNSKLWIKDGSLKVSPNTHVIYSSASKNTIFTKFYFKQLENKSFEVGIVASDNAYFKLISSKLEKTGFPKSTQHQSTMIIEFECINQNYIARYLSTLTEVERTFKEVADEICEHLNVTDIQDIVLPHWFQSGNYEYQIQDPIDTTREVRFRNASPQATVVEIILWGILEELAQLNARLIVSPIVKIL